MFLLFFMFHFHLCLVMRSRTAGYVLQKYISSSSYIYLFIYFSFALFENFIVFIEYEAILDVEYIIDVWIYLEVYLKKLWKNLCDQCSKYMKKIHLLTRSGAGTTSYFAS